jgi:hypothetical protein
MAPTQEIVQQPQAQEMMVDPSTQQANGVISQQPVCFPTFSALKSSLLIQLHLTDSECPLQKPAEQMTPDSEMHMRGGGVVGDWYV